MTRKDYYDDSAAPRPNAIVPAVSAVVTDAEGRVLLIHRTDNDRWALPGGEVELGENVSQAVIREVREETGLEVEITDFVGIYSDPKHIIAYEDGEVRQQFSLCFRARPIGGALRGSLESKEVSWVPSDELDALSIHPAQRLRVMHGLDPASTTPYIG
jgi:ADP-ribose pyrophosphatase YjhB (NUDIX family)